MAVDIRDVARAVGMSVATVSLALNNKGRVSAKTRRRIVDAAQELGYFPNSHAQGLRKGATGLVGFQIGHAAEGAPITDSAFATDLLNGASRVALQQGWLVVVIPPHASRNVLEKLDIRKAIILDSLGNETLLEHIRKGGGTAVTIGRPSHEVAIGDPGTIATIDYGVSAIVRTGLEHLFNSGYRKPALLTVSYGTSYITDTIAEFEAWAREMNIPAIIASSQKLDIAASAHIARDMLCSDNRPDAIYTTNEEGALGVVQAARQLGLRIPDQLGLLTTMNTPRLLQSDPSITALDLHPDRIGERAVSTLVGLAMGTAPQQSMPPAYELFIRRSTLRVSFHRFAADVEKAGTSEEISTST